MEYKRITILGIIIICFLILAGCRLIKYETETTTIYRNPNGNAKMTWQVSNIKSEGDDSEEQLEDYYQLLMFGLEESGASQNPKPNYIKLWINEDGFLELLAEFENSEQEIFEKANRKYIVKENTIMVIVENGASDEKSFTTNGEKIIDGDYLIIQWPIQARILKVSQTFPSEPYTVDWLADFFIQRNPKGFVEKHFD